MEMVGVVELQEKTSARGKTFFSVRCAGNYVGNAYESVVKDLVTGDYVRVTYEQKGNFKNVTVLEKVDQSTVPETLQGTTSTQTGTESFTREIPFPRGYEPHPVLVNEKALYLAQLFTNSQEETKKLTKKSLMTRLSVTFEIAKPIKKWLLDGTVPDGTEQLTDED